MTDDFGQIVQTLAAANIESPRLEARLIVAQVLNCRPDEVLRSVQLSASAAAEVNALVSQRLQHKPLDKILGHREFYKYDFVVNEDVLSPRPDTEILVECALEILQHAPESFVLDLGCGSGCIIETLLKEIPAAFGTAVDISDKALAVAEKNAALLNIGARLRFINADWFAADFASALKQKFDVIVSNPPYIPSADIAELATEVKDYDPLPALDGGADGYDSYKRIAEVAPDLLKEHGYVLLEAGINQAQNIADIFGANGFVLRRIVKDLAGISRCVILQKAVAENKKS